MLAIKRYDAGILAGPVMNLLLALAGLVLLKVLWPYQLSEWGRLSTAIISPLVSINIILAAFNLIPLPPLDGSKVLAGLLPDAGARLMYSLEQYGPLLLLLLIMTGSASKIFLPLANAMYGLLYGLVF